MSTSFAPKDFGTGRWAGGPATITNPILKYRSFAVTKGERAGQTVKNTTFYAELIDPEGNLHKAQYDLGNAEYAIIKDGPDDDANEAEEGVSVSSPDPARPYRVYPDSDFGKFTQSLALGGFPESKLQIGDVSLFDGTEAEFIPTKRNDADKFPLFLIKPGSVKLKGGAKRASATATKSGNGKADDVSAAALAAVNEALTEANGEAVPQAAVIRKAMAKYKGQDIKSEVVNVLSKAAFYENSDSFIYDATDKTITAV